MRILFIHEVDYFGKPVYEMHEFPELLSLSGHDVTFMEFSESYINSPRHLRTISRLVRGKVHPESWITLISPPMTGFSKFDRLLATIAHIPQLVKQISSKNYDVIYLLSVPTTGWQSVGLARLFGVPILFRALDVSHKIRRTVFSGIIKAAESYVYRNATYLSANTPAMLEYCRGISKRTKASGVQLPPVDLSHFQKTRNGITRSSLGISEKSWVIAYMGTFFDFSGLLQIMRDFALAKKEREELVLLLIGGGPLEHELINLSIELQIEDAVFFTGFVDYSLLPSFLKIADVAINPFEKELVTNVALPHKVLQYMASGIPAISTDLDGLFAVLGGDSGVDWVDSPAEIIPRAVAMSQRSSQELEKQAEIQLHAVNLIFNLPKSVTAIEEALLSTIESNQFLKYAGG